MSSKSDDQKDALHCGLYETVAQAMLSLPRVKVSAVKCWMQQALALDGCIAAVDVILIWQALGPQLVDQAGIAILPAETCKLGAHVEGLTRHKTRPNSTQSAWLLFRFPWLVPNALPKLHLIEAATAVHLQLLQLASLLLTPLAYARTLRAPLSLITCLAPLTFHFCACTFASASTPFRAPPAAPSPFSWAYAAAHLALETLLRPVPLSFHVPAAFTKWLLMAAVQLVQTPLASPSTALPVLLQALLGVITPTTVLWICKITHTPLSTLDPFPQPAKTTTIPGLLDPTRCSPAPTTLHSRQQAVGAAYCQGLREQHAERVQVAATAAATCVLYEGAAKLPELLGVKVSHSPRLQYHAVAARLQASISDALLAFLAASPRSTPPRAHNSASCHEAAFTGSNQGRPTSESHVRFSMSQVPVHSEAMLRSCGAAAGQRSWKAAAAANMVVLGPLSSNKCTAGDKLGEYVAEVEWKLGMVQAACVPGCVQLLMAVPVLESDPELGSDPARRHALIVALADAVQAVVADGGDLVGTVVQVGRWKVTVGEEGGVTVLEEEEVGVRGQEGGVVHPGWVVLGSGEVEVEVRGSEVVGVVRAVVAQGLGGGVLLDAKVEFAGGVGRVRFTAPRQATACRLFLLDPSSPSDTLLLSLPILALPLACCNELDSLLQAIITHLHPSNPTTAPRPPTLPALSALQPLLTDMSLLLLQPPDACPHTPNPIIQDIFHTTSTFLLDNNMAACLALLPGSTPTPLPPPSCLRSRHAPSIPELTSPPPSPRPDPPTLPTLLRSMLTGFPDPSTEARYADYQAAANRSLDLLGLLWFVLYTALLRHRNVIASGFTWAIAVQAIRIAQCALVVSPLRARIGRHRNALIAGSKLCASALGLFATATGRLVSTPQLLRWAFGRFPYLMVAFPVLLPPLCQQARVSPLLVAACLVQAVWYTIMLAPVYGLAASIIHNLINVTAGLLVTAALDVTARHSFLRLLHQQRNPSASPSSSPKHHHAG